MEDTLESVFVCVTYIIGCLLVVGVAVSIPLFVGMLMVFSCLGLNIGLLATYGIAYGAGVILAAIRNCPTINLTKIK